MSTRCRRQPAPIVRRLGVCLLSTCLLSSGGCALLRPAPPPPLPPAEVVAALRETAERFHTVTDTDISLHISVTADGKTQRAPSLGGLIAFNARLPGLWLDTEKVTRRVFSLKALGERFYLAIFETREVVTGGPAAYARLPHLVRPGEVRSFFAGPDRLGLTWPDTTMAVQADEYRFDVPVAGVLRSRVLVDRRKVVVTAIRRYDALGRTVTEVVLGGHKQTDGVPFPRRLTVERPLDGVKVELRLGDPRLNKELPAATFLPPQRPGWRVIDLDRQPLSAVEAFRTE